MDYFQVEFELFLRIVVSFFCGLCIGFERENRNKSAGIRTHAVVAMGAAIAMIVSKYGFSDVEGFAPDRIAAQVISGIGFLGAGLIFIRGNVMVEGLTTAAGVWATATIGLAIGAGLYIIGIVSAVFLIMAQLVLHRRTIIEKFHIEDLVTLEIDEKSCDIDMVIENLQKNEIIINSYRITKKSDGKMSMEMDITVPKEMGRLGFIKYLDKLEYVKGFVV